MGNKRFIALGLLLAMAWTGMLVRVFFVQVVQAEEYRELARNQSVRRTILPPKRGEILDRNLHKLVVNAEVEIEAAPLTGKEGRRLNRICSHGTLAGQVLGNVGRDGYGLLGLEYALDRELRGSDGWQYQRVDARHRFYPDFEARKQEPVNGKTVVLTLDAKIQSIVEHALERGVHRVGARKGVAVVVEPFSGDVLAMANYPFYDPNTRSDGDAWKNLAVTMVYEPGSTFKMVTAAALVEQGEIAPGDSLDAEGGTYRLANQIIRDTKPYDRLSFRDAMAYSSNIAFAKASVLIKPPDFYRYIRSFGFGIKTGIGLPAEEGGSLKPVSEWSGRTQGTMAFGHEISATPLQVTMAFAAVANGGMLMKPRIVKEWLDADGRQVRAEEHKSVRRILSPETAAQIKDMLAAVVEYGTAMDIRSDRISIAGKTGTAEKIDPETGKYLKGIFHSSFVGMIPVDRPQYVCLVLIDEPTQLKYGGQSAAPVFREITDRLMARPEFELGRLASMAPTAPEDSVVMPDLVGYPPEDGERMLRQFSFQAIWEGRGNRIFHQTPRAGTKVALRDTLRLELGYLDARSMPDVKELTIRDALLKLKNLGLKVEYTGNGKVIDQIPAQGELVEPGQKCVLVLDWVG